MKSIIFKREEEELIFAILKDIKRFDTDEVSLELINEIINVKCKGQIYANYHFHGSLRQQEVFDYCQEKINKYKKMEEKYKYKSITV